MSDPYWESRGNRGYRYRGEHFYTVTPVPLYYRRRRLLLEMMQPLIQESAARSICDFGCGDGYYIEKFMPLLPQATWHGVDVAHSMLEIARARCPKAHFHLSGAGVPSGMRFDLIYSIAVLAHVLDEELLRQLACSIGSALERDGLFVLFEQTGAPSAGDTWRRRSAHSYVSLMESCGLELVGRQLVAFPAHRIFERTVASWYYRLLPGEDDRQSRCLQANRSGMFRTMSSLALALDRRALWPDDGARSGNSFQVYRRAAISTASG